MGPAETCTSFAGKVARGSLGLAVAVPVYLKFADYKAALIDQEFLPLQGDDARPVTMPQNQAPAQALERLAPSLRTGDLVLFYGSGRSWAITRFGFLVSGFNLDALRYSHVAMVAAPLPAEAVAIVAQLKAQRA